MLFVPADKDREHWKDWQTRVAAKQREIDQRKESARGDFLQWLAGADAKPGGAPIDGTVLSLPLAGTNAVAEGRSAAGSLVWKGGRDFKAGPHGPAPMLAGGEPVEGPVPDLRRDGAFSYGAMVYLDGKPSGAIMSRMDRSEGYRGWDLLLTEGRPTVHIIDQYPGKALKITANEALKPGRWHQVTAVFDGRGGEHGKVTLYVDGQAAAAEINNSSLGDTIATAAPLRLGGRSDRTAVIDTIQNGKAYAQDVRVYDRALDAAIVANMAAEGLAASLAVLTGEERTAERTNEVFSPYLRGVDAAYRALEGQMAELRAEEIPLRERGAMTLIMGEAADRQPSAYILLRGSYSSKGDKVSPATPASLPAMKENLPRNRLGLARWLVSKDNPLTARVTNSR